MSTPQPHCSIDETALLNTLEGIPYPEHYFEFIYKTEEDMPDTFRLSVFPAFRTLLHTERFTIARAYIGAQEATEKQQQIMGYAYERFHIIDFEHVYPKGQGE